MSKSSVTKSPDKTFSLDSFIEMQIADNITYYNFSILEVLGKVQHTDRNIIEDYIDQLEEISILVELTDEQYKKYKYNPDLLAYDIYGSVQLDFVILLLNDMVDPKEFNLNKIKLPYSNNLNSFLNQVYQAEYQYMQINRSQTGLPLRV